MLKKFDQNDLLVNRMKTHPKVEFIVNSGSSNSVYYDRTVVHPGSALPDGAVGFNKISTNQIYGIYDVPRFKNGVEYLWRAQDVQGAPRDSAGIYSETQPMGLTTGSDLWVPDGGPNGLPVWDFDGTSYYTGSYEASYNNNKLRGLIWGLVKWEGPAVASESAYAFHSIAATNYPTRIVAGNDISGRSHTWSLGSYVDNTWVLVCHARGLDNSMVSYYTEDNGASENEGGYIFNQYITGSITIGAYITGTNKFKGKILEVGFFQNPEQNGSILTTDLWADQQQFRLELVDYIKRNYGIKLAKP